MKGSKEEGKMQFTNSYSRIVQTYGGASISRGLSELKVQLALVQAACIMAIEGTTRATASQIAARAAADYGIDASASFTGQVFATLNVNTVTTHGRSRLVLNHDHLEEVRKGIAAKCEELATKLEETIKEFQDLPDRIGALQEQWNRIQQKRTRERELANLIIEDREKPSRLPQLEAEAQKIGQQAAIVQALEEKIRELSLKAEKMSELDEKEKSLEEVIAGYEEKEKQFAARQKVTVTRWLKLKAQEEVIAADISKLQKRMGWVELATLEQSIKEARKELKELSKQLGEKRSLLDRLLNRGQGVDK